MVHILYFSLTQLYGGAFIKDDDLFRLTDKICMFNPAKMNILTFFAREKLIWIN